MARLRRPSQHDHLRHVLQLRNREYRLALLGILPHGDPRLRDHDAHLLLLGLQHHRLLDLPYADGKHDAVRRLRFLCCDLLLRLDRRVFLLSRS